MQRLASLLATLAQLCSSVEQIPVEGKIPDPNVTVTVHTSTVRPSPETGLCETNEIYIVDGDRTLVLTNNKMARDIDHIQVCNATEQIKDHPFVTKNKTTTTEHWSCPRKPGYGNSGIG